MKLSNFIGREMRSIAHHISKKLNFVSCGSICPPECKQELGKNIAYAGGMLMSIISFLERVERGRCLKLKSSIAKMIDPGLSCGGRLG